GVNMSIAIDSSKVETFSFPTSRSSDAPSNSILEKINDVRLHPKLYATPELLFFADDHFNLKDNSNFPIEVQWQILHACQADTNDDGTLNYGPEFCFLHLNGKDLALLFTIINSFQTRNTENLALKATVFKAMTFDIRDQILRLCIHDTTKANEALEFLKMQQAPELASAISMIEKTLDPSSFHPIFHSLTSNDTRAESVLLIEKKLEHVRLHPELYPSSELVRFADEHFHLKDNPNFPTEVKWQILHACHIKIEEDNTLKCESKFGFLHLNERDLALLFTIFNSFQNHAQTSNVNIFREITSDITAHISKLLLNDDTKKKADQFSLFLEGSHALESTQTVSGKVFSKIKDAQIVRQTVTSNPGVSSQRKVKIWKIAFENSQDPIGGIASVLINAYQAHKAMDLETVHSIHPFFTHHKMLVDLKFKGTIQHEFCSQIVTSSIYKNSVTGEYFIQPDQKFAGIFDVVHSKNVYSVFPYSPVEDRSAYLASAAAVAASTYCGKSGVKSVDILEVEGPQMSLSFYLMDQRLDQMRQECGLPSIARVFVTHMLSHHEQGILSSENLRKIGVDTTCLPETINLTTCGLSLSHSNIFVSKGIVKDILSPNQKLNCGLNAASGGPLKIKGITNGINPHLFDVTDSDSYETYSVQGGEFFSTQNRVKQTLFEADLIADAKKPLLLFIGRFSYEKGIKMLMTALEEVRAQNGQMVIMGTPTEDKESLAIIQTLKQLSETKEYKTILRVYLDRKDQTDTFPNCKVKKGLLLRQAASMALVPSFLEACGLVPMETQCTGAFTIAPYIQGLKDSCIPLHSPEITKISLDFKSGANAVCYQDCFDQQDLRAAIAYAYKEYNSLTDIEKNTLMTTLRDKAVQNYAWATINNGEVVGGAAYEYSKLYHQLVHVIEENPAVETLSAALARRLRQSHDVSRSAQNT
ncbi:MAG: glycosyltransferase, partial [Chlamydiota bacterium]